MMEFFTRAFSRYIEIAYCGMGLYPNDVYEEENERLYNSPFPESRKTYWPFIVIGIGMVLVFVIFAWRKT